MHDLTRRRLYLCTPMRDDMASFLTAVLRGGVDVVQLREKVLPHDLQVTTAREMAAICHDHDVPFIMNDSPEHAVAFGADGVHVGQDDVTVARCRELLGPGAIVGLSTHSTPEFELARTQDATYFSAGPIAPTPTKLGRAGTGVGYALECEGRSDRPVFVTGGINGENIGTLVGAGLRHFVVVRALTESRNPEESAHHLREALDAAFSAMAVEPT